MSDIKLIDANSLKVGGYLMIDGVACIAKRIDISKTGKHGHAKVRMEALGIFDDKKKMIVVPGHERFEVPLIDKAKAQVLSKQDKKANVMDLESFENFDIVIAEDAKDDIKEGDNVEYWNVEGRKIIKRKV